MNRSTAIMVQNALKSLGYYKASVDGIFGRKSKQALKVFQKDRGLVVDGIYGPNTRSKMFSRPEEVVEPGSWPRQTVSELTRYYGKVGTNQTRLKLPYTMTIAWNKSQKVNRIAIHEKCHDSAERVFNRIADHYSPEQIKEHGFDMFGGSLNVRKIRGGNRWSTHSWGIAIDFDPIRNQLRWGGDRAYLAKPECVKFWEFWEEEGWLSLGRAKNFDWMHIQAARL